MSLRTAWCELTERLGLADDWWSDVASYYGVSRRDAIRLGTRAPSRRPTLPGSPTCAPVSGKTWEEVWVGKPRTTPAEIASFYREVGSWCVFRQLVRHRGRGFQEVSSRIPPSGRFLEFGCGIAPVSWWMSRHRPDVLATLADVPSEPIYFAVMRMLHIPKPPALRLIKEGVVPSFLPSFPPCDVAVCLEVLEHVPSPILAMRAILAALK